MRAMVGLNAILDIFRQMEDTVNRTMDRFRDADQVAADLGSSVNELLTARMVLGEEGVRSRDIDAMAQLVRANMDSENNVFQTEDAVTGMMDLVNALHTLGLDEVAESMGLSPDQVRLLGRVRDATSGETAQRFNDQVLTGETNEAAIRERYARHEAQIAMQERRLIENTGVNEEGYVESMIALEAALVREMASLKRDIERTLDPQTGRMIEEMGNMQDMIQDTLETIADQISTIFTRVMYLMRPDEYGNRANFIRVFVGVLMEELGPHIQQLGAVIAEEIRTAIIGGKANIRERAEEAVENAQALIDASIERQVDRGATREVFEAEGVWGTLRRGISSQAYSRSRGSIGRSTESHLEEIRKRMEEERERAIRDANGRAPPSY